MGPLGHWGSIISLCSDLGHHLIGSSLIGMNRGRKGMKGRCTQCTDVQKPGLAYKLMNEGDITA